MCKWVIRVFGVLLVFATLGACITPPSLHSPRPVAPEEVQLGVHATMLLPPHFIDSQIEDDWLEELPVYFVPSPTFTVRYGIVDGLEVGAQLGLVGTFGSLKYGFFPHESPFQLSLVGGGGIWGLSALAGETISSLDIGALTGFDIEGVVMVYGGARYYFIGSANNEAIGSVRTTSVIAGAELFPENLVSVPLEVNYALSDTFNKLLSESGDDSVFVAWPSVNAGLTFTF